MWAGSHYLFKSNIQCCKSLHRLWDFTLSVLWYLAKLILLETLTQYLIEVTGQGWDIRLNIVLGLFEKFKIKSFIKIGREPGSRSRQGSGQPSILAFPRNGWGFVTTFFQKEGKWEYNGFFVKSNFYAAIKMLCGRWRETQIPLQMD